MSCDYIDPDLRRLFDFQHGLATNKQLRPFGYSPRRIQHLVESGQWTSVLHGVQSSTNGPLNRAMILEAALLFGGGETYLSHRTAAEEWGLTHIESELPVHITVRYGRSSRCQSPTGQTRTLPGAPRSVGVVHCPSRSDRSSFTRSGPHRRCHSACSYFAGRHRN